MVRTLTLIIAVSFFTLQIPSSTISASAGAPGLTIYAHIDADSITSDSVEIEANCYENNNLTTEDWIDATVYVKGALNWTLFDNLFVYQFTDRTKFYPLRDARTYVAELECVVDGLRSDQISLEFSTTYAPVENLTVTKNKSTEIEISWENPYRSYKDPITQFVAEISADSGATWTSNLIPGINQDSLNRDTVKTTFTNLIPNSEYQIRVRADSDGGNGDYAVLSSGARTPDVPGKPQPVENVTFKAVDFIYWQLQWSYADSTAEESTKYSYSMRKSGSKKWSRWNGVGIKLGVGLKQLAIGSKYQFRVLAQNSFGKSISKTFEFKVNKFYAAKKPGNLCEKNNEFIKQANGNVLKCTKGNMQTWLLYSSKNWPQSRIKAFNQLLRQLKKESTVISKTVNRGNSTSIAATSLLFEKSLEILSQVDSMPKGISYNNFIATTTVLKSEADLAAWEWFNGDAWSGRNRYQAILVVLNRLFTKLNIVLGTTYKIPYVVM